MASQDKDIGKWTHRRNDPRTTVADNERCTNTLRGDNINLPNNTEKNLATEN